MRSAIATLLLTSCSIPLAAQNFGEITGTVSDSTGAMIPGVSVTATNLATTQSRAVKTNDSGTYVLPYLVPGQYDIRVETQGFKIASMKDVTVDVGGVIRANFNLVVGDTTQQVEVSAAAPLLATENTTLGTVIENRRIVELPLNGRDYLQLVTLAPNVTREGGAGGAGGLQGGLRSQTSLSVAGQRLEFNRYTLAGVQNTDPNFNSYIIHPSVDAVQEFKVQTGVYSAEFGRGSSQINVTTKSGGNSFHGTAFEFLRNSAMDAREWRQSDGAKNPFRRNNYGFTLGGPVFLPKVFNGRDRLFFMSNYEALRDRLTTQAVGSTAPLAMRNGDFAGQNAIFDPKTRVFNSAGVAVSATPFANNQVPSNRFDPASIRLLEFYPAPTVPGNGLVRNYVRNAVSPTDSDQFNQRIDFNESSKSNWFGRYSWGNDLQIPSSLFITDSQQTATKVQQAMISNTRILNASTVNEARFSWNEFKNDVVGYFANTRDVQKDLGIVGLFAASPLAYGVPAVALGSGLNGFGGVTPWVTRNTAFQLSDSVSIVRGRHSLKVASNSTETATTNTATRKRPANSSSTGNRHLIRRTVRRLDFSLPITCWACPDSPHEWSPWRTACYVEAPTSPMFRTTGKLLRG